tara:strand:- start:1816 stop:2715 length:900 start_codon:yes stop_codon:yes gene_type:complete
MAKRILSNLSIYFAFFCLITACVESPTENSDEVNLQVDSSSVSSSLERNNTYYPIPSPEEMFDFIKSNQLDYDQSINQQLNIQNFQTEKEKALAFGIYSANLAYAVAYDDARMALNYYKTIRQLASELGIDGAMNQEIMNKLQKKLSNPDSLMSIMSASYGESVNFLEENKRGNIVAVIATSAWIESMYIVVNNLEYDSSRQSVFQRIADQRLVFRNLWGYLKIYEEDVMVNDLMSSLLTTRAIFDNFQEVSIGSSSVKKKGSKLIFAGGTKIEMSPGQYLELKEAIKSLRIDILKEKI